MTIFDFLTEHMHPPDAKLPEVGLQAPALVGNQSCLEKFGVQVVDSRGQSMTAHAALSAVASPDRVFQLLLWRGDGIKCQ